MKIIAKWILLAEVFVSISFFHRANALTIVHSNDVSGEVEPCGCRGIPQGGMARKSEFLKKLTDPWIIQVDTGDLLFPTQEIPEMLKKQSRVQAEYLLKAMDMTGHQFAVPGEKDYALGFATFEKLRKETKISFLAANLLQKSGGSYLKGDAIVTGTLSGKRVRVGFFGLVGDQLPWPRELKVESALGAAGREVGKLRSKVDFLIALTHQGIDADEALARKYPQIDFIIGAHSQSFLQTPRQVGKTVIFQSSFRNQYIGSIPVEKPFNLKAYDLLPLGSEFSTENSPMDKLVSEFKKSIGEINVEQEQALSKMADRAAKNVDKFHTFPRCAECHWKQFDFWRKTRHARALEPLIEAHQDKNKECLSCHSVGLGDPQGFSDVTALMLIRTPETEGKSKAWPTENVRNFLKAIHEADSAKDSIKPVPDIQEPRSIHEAMGYVSKAWVPVQCENCHQPGRNHPFSGVYSKSVDKNVCLKCHTAERAPKWYTSPGVPNWSLIDTKQAEVTCPAGQADPEP